MGPSSGVCDLPKAIGFAYGGAMLVFMHQIPAHRFSRSLRNKIQWRPREACTYEKYVVTLCWADLPQSWYIYIVGNTGIIGGASLSRPRYDFACMSMAIQRMMRVSSSMRIHWACPKQGLQELRRVGALLLL